MKNKKLLTLAALLAALLTSMAILLVYAYDENQRLKASLDDLVNANTEQIKLNVQKSRELEEYKTKEKTFNQKLNEFNEKYREILEKYVASRSSRSTSSVSRSADADEQSFSNDIGELKEMVSNINNYYGMTSLNSPGITAAENNLKLFLDSIPTLWPSTGRISDKFGYRRDPFTNRKTFHEGLDIAASYGSGIKASAAGKVIKAATVSGYGRTLIIDHGRGLSTLYAHASKLLVKEGQTVKKGDVIAKIGSSGRSTGPHLHFEVRINNSPVDPLLYLDEK